ncbi:hypothetical protein MLD38_017866 [Melastoma candidum]|uniref:Uncharacterized protein n=1 Tax=Melastoma candidum TaxID=119954 RepID=A0ACB9R099_9MYRT|nr:hypothetical protein MLD38_017866 [Melastoma candidum]
MSQEQPIRYGDVFPELHGVLAEMPATTREAAMMQTAKTMMLGRTTRGGLAAVMQSAAARNEKAGRLITETIGGQIVGKYRQRTPLHMMTPATIYQHDNVVVDERI